MRIGAPTCVAERSATAIVASNHENGLRRSSLSFAAQIKTETLASPIRVIIAQSALAAEAYLFPTNPRVL